MAELSSQNAIWQVLDRLRGDSPLTGGEFGVALAALIYLRWADFREAEQEAVAAFDDSTYEPVLPGRFHWRSYCEQDPRDILELFSSELPGALERLGNSRHNHLATHLHRIAPAVARLGKLSVRVLDHLVKWLAAQPFETPGDRRKLLEVLDEVLHRSLDKSAGQFFTPPTVAKLLVELAAPSPGDRVYDPCFGSAGLLTAAVDYAQQHATDRVTRAGQPLLHIAGVEIRLDSYTIGLTRLALAGIADPQLEVGNSLERTPPSNPQSDGFDIVLANPPWGGKVDLSGLDHFPIRTNDSAALFTQHALAQLRPGGRAVIVVPPSILFGSGALLRLREMLLEQNTVEAVVALPEGVFLPYTSIKSSILVIRRGGSTQSVRMVDASSIFESKHAREGVRLIRPLVAEFIERVRSPSRNDKDGWEIPVDDLAKIDWDLTPKRRDQSGLDQILRSLPPEVKLVSLGDVCHVMSGRSIRAEELQDTPPQSNFEPSGQTLFPDTEREGINPQRVLAFADNPIPYIRIRDVQNGVVSKGSSWLAPTVASSLESRWKLCAGDLLLSKSGTIGKAGIVRNGAVGAVAASGFFVLRVMDAALDPHYLLAYLQSAECNAWLDDRARGSGIRHLSFSVVKGLPVPVPPLQIQERVAKQWRQHAVDALSFLAELLTEDRSEPLAVAVNAWVDATLVGLDRHEGSNSLETNLDLLEQVAESSCPINTCESCGKPYFLDYDSQYIDPPHDYRRGIQETCLACWLDVGPSPDTIESLREKSPLVPWALAFREACSPLKSVRRVSDAAGLLNVLQSVSAKLTSVGEMLKGHLPNEEKARRLTANLHSFIELTNRNLLDDIKIAVKVIHAIALEKGETDIALQIRNEGKLPLRDMSFTTRPQLRHESAYLSYQLPGEADAIQFIGALAASTGTASLELQWTGRTLDGTRFTGSRHVSIDATQVSTHEDRVDTELGTSPYICGSEPVKPERDDVFFGRDELLQQIRRQITQSGNVVLLEGNRRAGKSSILWHLEGKDAVPGWLGVYCSFQGGDSAKSCARIQMSEGKDLPSDSGAALSTAGVFRLIAYEIAQSMRKLNGSAVLPDGTILDENRKLGIDRSVRTAISEEAPFADFREYLALTLETLSKQGLGLLLMLDEFDKLQEGIDKKVTSPQVPENIRFLVQTYSKCSAILTGSRRLKKMREEYWSALFGLGTRFGVTSLPKDAAERLVTDPVKGRLTYAKDAVDLAYTLTAGQPYLLQCLCNRVFDIAARAGIRSITVDQVRAAADALVEDNEHFASLWDYTMFERRRFLLAVLHREESGPDPLRLGVLQEKLASYGVDIKEDTLIADLDYLRELELIDLHGESGGAHYTLTIPMMGDWIEHQHDFDALKGRARAEIEDSDD